MHRRLVASLALVSVAGLVAVGCSGRNDSGGPKRTTTTTRATAGSTGGSTTSTTTATDLAAVNVKLTKLASLERPTAMAIRKGDQALYVIEKVGRVRALRNGQLDPNPVLDISSLVGSSGNEQGLLGLAFSPDGTKLYVDYTNRNGDTRVDEYAVNASGTVDKASRREVLAQAQPQQNHNGGNLGFGPDGLLYISFGDGGAAGDVGPGHVSGGNGQSRATLLGKILRIDPTPSGGGTYTIPADNPFVNTAGVRPEIWAYGLRNPWRFSWDSTTGDLWIGDVGQDAWEEVDLATKASGGGRGVNYGWNVWEGTHSYRSGDAPGAVAPVFDYSHDGGNCSVTGGYVYRGSHIPALRGGYLFADYCGGALRALAAQDGKVVQDRILPVRASTITSFGQDADGELYVLSDGGDVYRVDPA
ncbi:MAG: PQQ-dependent sugar dehydrogenase [Acidimicrobiia bacterium]